MYFCNNNCMNDGIIPIALTYIHPCGIFTLAIPIKVITNIPNVMNNCGNQVKNARTGVGDISAINIGAIIDEMPIEYPCIKNPSTASHDDIHCAVIAVNPPMIIGQLESIKIFFRLKEYLIGLHTAYVNTDNDPAAAPNKADEVNIAS